jgi:hypothetical protein
VTTTASLSGEATRTAASQRRRVASTVDLDAIETELLTFGNTFFYNVCFSTQMVVDRVYVPVVALDLLPRTYLLPGNEWHQPGRHGRSSRSQLERIKRRDLALRHLRDEMAQQIEASRRLNGPEPSEDDPSPPASPD